MTATPATTDLYSTQLGTSGPRVAFLHGLFGQGRNWTSVAKALADEYRLILVDLPNHGRSGWTESFSYPEMASAVASLLDGQAAGDQVSVVGHSMGGKVAMALALLHPEVVERLCVVDVSPVPTSGVSAFAAYVAGMRSLDLERLPDRASADAHLQPYVPDPVIRSFLLQNLRRDGDRWRWQMNLALLGDELDTVGGWPDLTAEPYRAQPYPGPVLWVRGSRSDYVQPAHAPVMRALFPRVRSVVVKEAGHWVHADQPEVFASLVRRFLDGPAAP